MRLAAIASFTKLASGGVLAALAACSYPTLPRAVSREHKDLPVTVNRAVDLLFLVDDSPSMADKQINLVANFPRFIDVLGTVQGGLPDVHIAVATTDMGTQAAGDASPGPAIGAPGMGGCTGLGKNGAMQLFGAPVTGSPFLADVFDATAPGGRQRNYTGNLTDVFAQMARAGTTGCGFEQPLAAIQRALDPGTTANGGFLRPDAYLGVILISDEDDCSLEHTALLGADAASVAALGALQSFRCTRFGVTCEQNGQAPDAMNQVGPKGDCHPSDTSAYLTRVADHAGFLKRLKPGAPDKIIVAGIVGTTTPVATELRAQTTGGTPIPALAHSCTYIGGDGKPEVADPPIRIKAFLDQFPDRNAIAPICQQDLSGGLAQFADLLKTAIGDPCLTETLADTDPKLPGSQYDCDVSVTDPAQPGEPPTGLPRCSSDDASAANQPCWHLGVDPMKCKSLDHQQLVIEGLGRLAATAHVIASCTVEPSP